MSNLICAKSQYSPACLAFNRGYSRARRRGYWHPLTAGLSIWSVCACCRTISSPEIDCARFRRRLTTFSTKCRLADTYPAGKRYDDCGEVIRGYDRFGLEVETSLTSKRGTFCTLIDGSSEMAAFMNARGSKIEDRRFLAIAWGKRTSHGARSAAPEQI